MRPVGVLRTCFPEKFGVPRQSGLVPAAWGEVVLEPEFAHPEAVRGLEAFSHVWLITVFHLCPPEHGSLTVRPPRLGGNERLGVFATRAPFRPNRIALSAVRLEGVICDAKGVRLTVSGVDAVDGTPVLDIKPYVPYADSIPEARGGFAATRPEAAKVVWECARPTDETVSTLIEQTLSLSPQPAFHEDSTRIYRAQLQGMEVEWREAAEVVHILQARPVKAI